MGVLERHGKWIEKLHGDFEVFLKIGKQDARITHRCGVRQSDNFAPTLFIIVTQLDEEDIIESLKRAGIDAPKIRCDPNED